MRDWFCSWGSFYVITHSIYHTVVHTSVLHHRWVLPDLPCNICTYQPCPKIEENKWQTEWANIWRRLRYIQTTSKSAAMIAFVYIWLLEFCFLLEFLILLGVVASFFNFQARIRWCLMSPPLMPWQQTDQLTLSMYLYVYVFKRKDFLVNKIFI